VIDENLFENVAIEGIGDLRSLAELSADEVIAWLAADRVALISANATIPAGWPTELFRNAAAEFEVDGQRQCHEINTWYLAEARRPWRRFYAFSLTAYVQWHKLVPAFIYQQLAHDMGVSYLPVVSLLLSLDGRVRQASKSWCDRVRASSQREC
jgi:hypothetical protein